MSLAARRSLEQLLNCRERTQSLPPVRQPPSVGGGEGVAYGPFGPEYFEEPETASFYVDTGLIIVDINFLGVPINYPIPLPIYGNTELRDYAGTIMPDSSTDYLIKEGVGATCPEFLDAFSWGAEGEYLSEKYINSNIIESLGQPCAIPGLYTGITKWAVQAKLGAGKSPADMAAWSSSGCALDPYRDGIFKDDNNVYWVFRTDSTGCKCARLQVTEPLAQCMANWVNTGLFTGHDAIRAETYVLQDLTVEMSGGSPVEYQLLTSTDLLPVYSDGREPLGDCSWAYSHGHTGVNEGEVTEAAIVTHKVFDNGSVAYRQATQARILFDLTGVTPSASIVLDVVDQEWEPSSEDEIFYPVTTQAEQKLCYVDLAASIIFSPRGVNAPLFVFYRVDGLERLLYTYRHTGSLVSDTLPLIVLCGPGSAQYTGETYYGGAGYKGGIWAERSGLYANTQIPTNQYSSHRYDEWKLQASETGSLTGTYASRTQIRIWADGSCNNMDSTTWPAGPWDYNIKIGTGSGYRLETRSNSVGGVRIAVIPHGEREAVYIAEIIRGTIVSQTRTNYSDWEDVDPIYALTPSVFVEKPSEGWDGADVKVPMQPGNNSPWWLIQGRRLLNTMRATTGTPLPVGAAFKRCEAGLATAHKVLRVNEGISQDYDDWLEWPSVVSGPLPCHDRTQFTQVSFHHGDTWFSAGPSTSKELYGGHLSTNWPSDDSHAVIPVGWD